jgi:hypothetical protein
MKNPRITTTYSKLREALFSTELQTLFHNHYVAGEEISESDATLILAKAAAIPAVALDISVNGKLVNKTKNYVDNFNGVPLDVLEQLEEIVRDLRIIYIEKDPLAVPPRKMFKASGDVNPAYSRLANIYKILRYYWDYLQENDAQLNIEEFDYYRLILAYAVKNTRIVPFSEQAISDQDLERGYNYAYRYIQNNGSIYGPYVKYTLAVYAELGSYVNEDLFDNQRYQSRARLLTKEIVDRLIEKRLNKTNIGQNELAKLINENKELIEGTLLHCVKHSLSVFPTTKLAKKHKSEGDVSSLSALEIGFVFRNNAFSDFKTSYAQKNAKKKRR